MKNFFKDKNSRNFIFGILGIIIIFIYPPLWILFLIIAVFGIFFEALNQQQTKEKNTKNTGYYIKRANAIRDAFQGRKPRTFYEVMGDLGNYTWNYYSEQLYNPEKVTNENEWIIEQFDRTKKIFDDFFDGKNYIKYWTIYRALERKGIAEKDIYNAFPNLEKEIKKIREKNWEEIAWDWSLVDKVDEVNQRKDTCTKESFQKIRTYFDEEVKKKFLDNLTEEQKNEYKLLTVLDLDEEKKKDIEIINDYWKSMPDPSKLGREIPNKINSKITWSLEDSIELGEIIINDYYERGVNDFNAFEVMGSDIMRKKEQLAGNIESDETFKEFLGTELTKDIKDFDRVKDFLKFEKYDPNPIQTAIDNEDIERIIFYSFLEIPKSTLLNVAWEDEEFITDPVERAPYFAITQIHTTIILRVLENFKVYDDNEMFIKIWILNQIVDPLDKGELADHIINKAMKDERFVKEIWWGLYKMLSINFLTEGLKGDISEVIAIADTLCSDVLKNYFLKDPEDAYSLIKPLNETFNEELLNEKGT